MRFLALAAVLGVALFLSGCTIPAASIAPENCAAGVINGGFESERNAAPTDWTLGMWRNTGSPLVAGMGSWYSTPAYGYVVPGSVTQYSSGVKVSAFEGSGFALFTLPGSSYYSAPGVLSQSVAVQPGATYVISAETWKYMNADEVKITVTDSTGTVALIGAPRGSAGSGGDSAADNAAAQLWSKSNATFKPASDIVVVSVSFARNWGWGGAGTPRMVFGLDNVAISKVENVEPSDLSCVSCEGSGSRCVADVVWRCDGAVFQRLASCGGNGCDGAGVACFVPVATPAPTPTPNIAVSPSPYVSPSTTPGTTGNNGGASDVIGWLFANPLWLFGIIGLVVLLFKDGKRR